MADKPVYYVNTTPLYYVDTVPLGRGYKMVTNSAFFARSCNIPEEVALAIQKNMEDWATIQAWLAGLYPKLSNKNFIVEVPEQVKEILCLDQQSDKPRKKKATGARSSKKSQSKQRKTESSSNTKDPKA